MAAAASSPYPTVLAQLRAATSELHTELDRQLGLRVESLTCDRYVTFLRASIAVAAPLEGAIAQWLGAAADGVTRAGALRADLAALGSTEGDPVAVPELRSVAEAMGALYVVEGSALGGAVLARTVAAALGAEAPRRYLILRAERTGERWREIVHMLETWGASAAPEEREAACAAARSAFAAYAASFSAGGAFA